MRIAVALVLSVGCGSTEEAPPGCARAYDAQAASFESLHADAGKPMPALPDRSGWVATCDGLGLDADAIACLEPNVVAADPDGCATALEGIDRTPLDGPFLAAMIPGKTGATGE